MTDNTNRTTWKRCSVIGIFAFLVGFAGAYVWNGRQIQNARSLRRDDELADADSILSRCWNLPGHREIIDFETKLAAVQQGDLREETHFNELAKKETLPATKNLIQESLCKGNMAVFRWNEARLFADEMLKSNDKDSTALWLRGRCWVKLQQEQKALQDFKKAVDVSPNVSRFRVSLAELLRQQGFNRLAMNHYCQIAEERQLSPEALLGLCRCLVEAGELAEAERTFQVLLETHSSSATALIQRGRLELRKGLPANAEQWASKAMEVAPKSLTANAFMLLCLIAQDKDTSELQDRIEQDERTRVAWKRLLRDSSKDTEVVCRFGDFMMSTGEESEALGCYHRALGIDPTSAIAMEALASYFERAGQLRLASQYRKSIGNPVRSTPSISIRRPLHAALATDRKFELRPIPESKAVASTEQVYQLCGKCHAYPTPESFPRSAWRKEVQLGFDFLHDSSLSGNFPSMESVVRYYEERAPESLSRAQHSPAKSSLPFEFEVAGGGWINNLPPFPATTHVNFVPLRPRKNLDLLVCDARLDRVLVLETDKAIPEWKILGPALVPGHAETVDLDQDGLCDVIVACLGQFFPTDDKVGSVVWLHAEPGGGYEPITLLEGVGRVADVQPGDFNGDGKTDLIVAVFGWRTGGEILYLENQTSNWKQPQFVAHRIDERHGAINVSVTDLNRDGRPDFVALISQEHEQVVAFLNQGNGQFNKETIFAAPHPAYGCSGIQLVDMDFDNDLDVLLSNGDSLDRPYILKPYHGVQWLENDGKYPYRSHSVGALSGVSRAVAADMDGDQDMDVVAVSFLPAAEFPERVSQSLPSAILYEQISPNEFAAHVLESGSCDHFSCAVADWNRDGQMDLSLGNFSWKRSQAIPDAALLLKGVSSK